MTELKVMPVEQCKLMGTMYYRTEDFKGRMNRNWREPSMLEIADFALKSLEAARKGDIETHEKNLPAIEMNKRIREQITALNTAVSMPDGWTERDPNSRARIPRRITHRAGWRQDLDKHVIIADGFEQATANYEQRLKDYTTYREAALRDDEQRKRAAEREKEVAAEKRRNDIQFAGILLRYELPTDSEYSDVLDALRKRDKKLDLAIAMEDTRGDWSEGYWRVSNAVDRFTMETEEDKLILNDIMRHLGDEDIDGRCFRDTTYSYTVLFGMVDQQLLADANVVRNLMRD